ncbi:MAG: polyphenol oxidase family protein [Silvanigrellales bacterium]|nr:polyphenol oxidase family protein [Silvanigrellales bacterium]
MLFLHESPVPTTPAGLLPASFQAAFRPECVSLPSPGASVLSADIPFARAPARVAFTLENPLPGAARVRAVHGATIARLPLEEDSEWPEADGLYTFGFEAAVSALEPMAISTADCLAVAFAVSGQGYAGFALVHAGWRGYTAGMLQGAVRLLLEEGAARGMDVLSLLQKMEVVISPAIFGESYECGPDVRDALETHFANRILPSLEFGQRKVMTEIYHDCLHASVPNGLPEKIHPDLQLLAACDLVALGLPSSGIRIVRVNTAGHRLLPSYRHASLHGGNAKRRFFTHLVFT